MVFTAGKDTFGQLEHWDSKKVRNVLDLLDKYFGEKPYEIMEIRQDNVNDPYGRIDVEVVSSQGTFFWQKLLILNNEVIDGKTFHKRYHEWYR